MGLMVVSLSCGQILLEGNPGVLCNPGPERGPFQFHSRGRILHLCILKRGERDLPVFDQWSGRDELCTHIAGIGHYEEDKNSAGNDNSCSH